MARQRQPEKILAPALVALFMFCIFSGTAQARRVTDTTTESVDIAETLHVTSTGETIDASDDVGQYDSLALDSLGYAHVSFYDAANGDLKYAANSSGAWVTTTLDSGGYVGEYSSLKIDSSDKVHIAYFDGSNGALKYAANASGAWVTSVVADSSDSEESYGAFCALALDSSDNPYIIYNEENTGSEETHLMYATNDGGAWATQRVSDHASLSGLSSIAVDSQGFAHISFYYSGIMSGTVMYATNVSGSWTMTYPKTCGKSTGRYSSIALDSAENPYISFYESSYGSPRFATNIDGDWSCETFSTGHNDGLYTSLVLDANDNAFISYYDTTDGALKFMTNVNSDKTSWDSVVLDDEGDVGQYSSLALDHDGYFHVSYYDASNRDLKYLKFAIAGDTIWYADDDGDGFGDAVMTMFAWQQPDGYRADASDCDDSDSNINPDAGEFCGDSLDNDCNGVTDDGCVGEVQWDADGDGYSEDEGDCDDTTVAISPVAPEVCDGIDNDCDHKIDEYDDDVTDAGMWRLDTDGDGYGDESSSLVACGQPVFAVALGGDCDDNDSTSNPSALESCDGVDNNCDGVADELTDCSLTSEPPTDTFGDEVGEENSGATADVAASIDNSLGACALVRTHQAGTGFAVWPGYLLGLMLLFFRQAHLRR